MKEETINDIVSELRCESALPTSKDDFNESLRGLASRIEAAAKREISEAQDMAASQAALDRTANDAMEYYAQALKQKQPAPGNSAALREALRLCVHEMCKYCRSEAAITMPGKECIDGCEMLRIAKDALSAPPEPPSDAAKMREALEYASEVLALNGFVEPVVRCDAALAAPARNCDRFAAGIDAFDAFFRENDVVERMKILEKRAKKNKKPESSIRFTLAVGLCDWLFAPAEGGAE